GSAPRGQRSTLFPYTTLFRSWTRSDGGGAVERLAGVSRNAGPGSFSGDGKWLAFWPLQPGSDLWTVRVERTPGVLRLGQPQPLLDRKSTRLNSSHQIISYAVF